MEGARELKRVGRGLWKGEIEIYFKLAEKPMTWTELKKATGFSGTTLSAYLKHLMEWGYITLDSDTRNYRSSAYFLEIFPSKINEAYRLIEELDKVGDIIEKGGIGKRLFEVNEATVKTHALFIAATMPALLYACLGGKGYTVKPEDRAKPGYTEELMNKMWKDSHDIADDLLNVLVRPWIHKLLDVLMVLSSSNKDILTETGGPLIEAALKELKVYDKTIKPLIGIKTADGT